jgi:hypothetical protein
VSAPRGGWCVGGGGADALASLGLWGGRLALVSNPLPWAAAWACMPGRTAPAAKRPPAAAAAAAKLRASHGGTPAAAPGVTPSLLPPPCPERRERHRQNYMHVTIHTAQVGRAGGWQHSFRLVTMQQKVTTPRPASIACLPKSRKTSRPHPARKHLSPPLPHTPLPLSAAPLSARCSLTPALRSASLPPLPHHPHRPGRTPSSPN